jgi:hypothetical protein
LELIPDGRKLAENHQELRLFFSGSKDSLH